MNFAPVHSAEDGSVPSVQEGEVAAENDGTPPDGWSFIPTEEATDDPDRRRALMQERLALWQPEMTFARVTVTDGPYATEGWPEGIWIEVWKVPPEKQAAFNPPVTEPSS